MWGNEPWPSGHVVRVSIIARSETNICVQLSDGTEVSQVISAQEDEQFVDLAIPEGLPVIKVVVQTQGSPFHVRMPMIRGRHGPQESHWTERPLLTQPRRHYDVSQLSLPALEALLDEVLPLEDQP